MHPRHRNINTLKNPKHDTFPCYQFKLDDAINLNLMIQDLNYFESWPIKFKLIAREMCAMHLDPAWLASSSTLATRWLFHLATFSCSRYTSTHSQVHLNASLANYSHQIYLDEASQISKCTFPTWVSTISGRGSWAGVIHHRLSKLQPIAPVSQNDVFVVAWVSPVSKLDVPPWLEVRVGTHRYSTV